MQHTRVAPSPTGDMHLGTARCAYHNWLVARATGGNFFLRIDDTDDARNRQECVDVILSTMEWLGLDYDDLFYQSDRTKLYQEMAIRMYEHGLAVRLDNGAVALRWPDDMPQTWRDTIAGDVKITERNFELIDQRLILLKGRESKYAPTYQLATVVDDYLLGINRVIRGSDHQSNTPKQVAIWLAMQKVADEFVPLPQFTHVGLVFSGGKKLSKRDAAASMLHYRDSGYLPDALLNFMLRMGWGPAQDDKSNAIIDRDRAVQLFAEDIANDRQPFRNSQSGFDAGKLEWFQKRYTQLAAAA